MPTKTKRKPKTLDLAEVTALSELLAIGLRDLRKQERAKDSVVQMDCWLKANGKCAACLAGSVLRFSLKRVPKIGGWPMLMDYFGTDEKELKRRSRLYALNELRIGLVSEAAATIERTTSLNDPDIPDYDGPNGKWWKAMESLLKELREAGE